MEMTEFVDLTEYFRRSKIHLLDNRYVMPVAGHVSCAIGNFILVYGGYYSTSESDMYNDSDKIFLYHTPSAQWFYALTTGQIPPENSGCCGIVDGIYFYVFGGFLDANEEDGILQSYRMSSNRIYRLDLHSLEWILLTPKGSSLPTPRHKLVGWPYDNKLWFFSGYGPYISNSGFLLEPGNFVFDDSAPVGNAWNNQLLTYDLSESRWNAVQTFGDCPSPRAAHAAVMLADGPTVLVFGGRHQHDRLNDLYTFDVQTLLWKQVHFPEGSNIPCGRSWHSMALVAPQIVLLYGGYSTTKQPLDDCWQLDLSSWSWTCLGTGSGGDMRISVQFLATRLWHTATVDKDGFMHIFGGAETDILNTEIEQHYSDEMICIRTNAASLKRLSLLALRDSCKQARQRFINIGEDELLACYKKMLPVALSRKLQFIVQPAKYLNQFKVDSVMDLIKL